MKSTDSVIVSWDFSHGKDAGYEFFRLFKEELDYFERKNCE